MNISSTFGRFAAMAALAGSLGFAASKPASAETYAYWSSVVAHVDGHPVCGVRTNMTDGANLRLMTVDNQVRMIAFNPYWTMRPGNTVAVTVSIDGDIFRGSASVVDGQTLVLPNLTRNFFGAFRDGDDMVADFGGIRWHVGLAGSTAATDDMFQCIQEAGSGQIS